LAGLASGFKEEFRAAGGHFVPYVQIPFEAVSLVEIRQGPGAYRSANAEALRRLLEAESLGNTKILKSPVPL
jgi:hypothetical protein